ncbi:Eukaryotic translation initiation factor 3 subunit G [Mitosporidium daphniae]|uniref:Eukaryotic translation initiation factor 3 subunit G n=1 Tax=Mitosporidium daphniae TaxID=1485682 RepID=A0A098VVG0_9MICR|nr:subunit G of eukaryotic translation initiation factor 3 [Mitosporidium daphniae]KGG53133.1 subunit G of eukaryotic translation initiation factor 3 [Mitosporidium daphniae]|eukprot:XP_013239560.1 subunit G of eukaryotic translation initiation factor 3 [Mitosporidium daphniae]
MSAALGEMSSSPVIIETLTEERIDDVGRKVITKRKIQKKLVVNQVSEIIASRRSWTKFGEARSHPPGPNTKTTLLGEPVFLYLAAGKDFELEESGQSTILKLEQSKSITCRYCEGSHWTRQCPYKDRFVEAAEDSKSSIDSTAKSPAFTAPELAGRKYVAPSLRSKDSSSSSHIASSPCSSSSGPEVYTVRVTNLSENTTENDLRELFLCAGTISRLYLSKDPATNLCKGYAFVSFYKKSDADQAIAMINNHGYDNLILKVEFAKYN